MAGISRDFGLPLFLRMAGCNFFARTDVSGSMRRAFTLIELLVVIVLIGILATLVGVVAERYVEAGRTTSCMNNLRTLGSALNLYLGENNGIMPTLKLGREKRTDDVPVVDNTLDHYLPGDSGKKAFLCPSDREIGAKSGTSYHWNVALNGQSLASLNFMGVAEQPGYIPLMGDKEGFHRDPEHKVNILYADGHASKELTFVDKPKN